MLMGMQRAGCTKDTRNMLTTFQVLGQEGVYAGGVCQGVAGGEGVAQADGGDFEQPGTAD